MSSSRLIVGISLNKLFILTRDDIKSHHYIIIYDSIDAEDKGFTAEHAQEPSMEYARKYFPRRRALVCTYTEGHNGSRNIHTLRIQSFQ